jgi:hypothetical protein
MYCPVCFQDVLRIKSNGVIKLAFNGKSKNSSLFTYNLQKETQEQLLTKLNDKVEDFFSFYSQFQNKIPMKTFEAYSSDFLCTSGCKIDLVNTRVSVIGLVYSISEIKSVLEKQGKKFGITIEVYFK